jgi:hypothetical protein
MGNVFNKMVKRSVAFICLELVVIFKVAHKRTMLIGHMCRQRTWQRCSGDRRRDI